MVVSLARMLQSFGQAQNDLPTLAAENAQRASINQDAEVKEARVTEGSNQVDQQPSTLTPPERRIVSVML